MVYRHLQHFESVMFRCRHAADRRLRLVLILSYFFRRHGGIGHFYLLPAMLLLQIDRTLHQRLGMGIDRTNIR